MKYFEPKRNNKSRIFPYKAVDENGKTIEWFKNYSDARAYCAIKNKGR